MKKISNLFVILGELAISSWQWLKSKTFSNGLLAKIFGGISGGASWLKRKIFKESAASRKARIIRIVGVIILALIVIGLLAWWIVGKFISPDVDKPIAEARVYVVSSRSCGQKCWDTSLFIDALKNRGVKVTKITNAYYGWIPFSLGNRLVKELNITKLPTVVIELTGKDKPNINKFFTAELGTVTNDKFVLTKILAPYFDVKENKIKGLIDVTILKDSTCKECYDTNKHELALKNLGIYPKSVKTVEVSSKEGQALITKYAITKVPTLLVSGEVSEYQALNFVWADLGVIAPDGTYVFTNVDLMGDSYKDLTTGKIIKADLNKATVNAKTQN